MDATITDTILQSPSTDVNPSTIGQTSPALEGSSNGWNMSTIMKYALIILILAFLGFNLFAYLGGMTGGFVKIFGPVLGALGKDTGETIKQVTDTTAVGAKTTIDIAAGSVDSGINLLEKGLDGDGAQRSRPKSTQNVTPALAHAERQQSDEPEPDDAGSRTQMSRTTGKAGFCYIGEDRGYRSCLRVGEGDACMSGEIFPTRDICINPNLRQ